VVLSEFATLLDKARRVAVALGRTIAVGSPVPAAR
jgi:hypothetical protein